jgi:hypothetical protein
VGKVISKSNGDEVLSDEFVLKSNGDEALNDVFPQKVTVMKRLMLRKKTVAMKGLMLLNCFIASSTLYKSMQKLPQNRAKHICKGKDDDVFRLYTETTEITNFFGKLPMEMIASLLQCVNIFFVKALKQWRQIWEAMK